MPLRLPILTLLALARAAIAHPGKRLVARARLRDRDGLHLPDTVRELGLAAHPTQR